MTDQEDEGKYPVFAFGYRGDPAHIRTMKDYEERPLSSETSECTIIRAVFLLSGIRLYP